jgi:hypothetical protein
MSDKVKVVRLRRASDVGRRSILDAIVIAGVDWEV